MSVEPGKKPTPDPRFEVTKAIGADGADRGSWKLDPTLLEPMVQINVRPDLLKRLIDLEEVIRNGPLAKLTPESEWIYDRMFATLMLFASALDKAEKETSANGSTARMETQIAFAMQQLIQQVGTKRKT